MSLKFDISCPNLDNYFAIQSAGMGENQKDCLPKELVYKVFKKGGRPNSKSTNKLSFLAKIYILIKSLKKRVIILIEDDVNGMDEEQYFKYKKMLKKNDLSIQNSTELVSDLTFVLANKEIMDTYSAINRLSMSYAYNYLTKIKETKRNKGINKTDQWNKKMSYILRLFSQYEANRKKIAMQTGINFSEWMVLIYLYDGKEYTSVTIYKEWYKHSFNSSATKLKTAFSSLQILKYVEKIGTSRAAKLRITYLGKEKVNEIVGKYIINH